MRTFAALYVSPDHATAIRRFFSSHGIRHSVIKTGLHVTLYQNDVNIPGMDGVVDVNIDSDTVETRFAVAGASDHLHTDPNDHKIVVRFTKRNLVIPTFDRIRNNFVAKEPPGYPRQVKGYHITMLDRNNGLAYDDVSVLAKAFREEFRTIAFSRLVIEKR